MNWHLSSNTHTVWEIILLFPFLTWGNHFPFPSSWHSMNLGRFQELGFDYLRDNLAGNNGQLVMRWYVMTQLEISCHSFIELPVTLLCKWQAKAIPFCYSWWSWLSSNWWRKKSFIDKWRGKSTFTLCIYFIMFLEVQHLNCANRNLVNQ